MREQRVSHNSTIMTPSIVGIKINVIYTEKESLSRFDAEMLQLSTKTRQKRLKKGSCAHFGETALFGYIDRSILRTNNINSHFINILLLNDILYIAKYSTLSKN